jgi:hypothetical protein
MPDKSYKYSVSEGGTLFRSTDKTVEAFNSDSREWEVPDMACGVFMDSRPITKEEVTEILARYGKRGEQ